MARNTAIRTQEAARSPQPFAEAGSRDLVGRRLAEIERDAILATLTALDGNRTRAAEMLAISPRSLRGKLAAFAAAGHAVPASAAARS